MSLIRGKRVKSMLKQAAADYRFQTSDFKVQSALDIKGCARSWIISSRAWT